MTIDIHLVNIVNALLLQVYSVNANNLICKTPACLETAKTFLNNMDKSVDPCQDFYRFACGGFLNKTKIPEERHMWTATSELELSVLRRIYAELNSSRILDHKPRYFQLARDFFKSCMDTDAIEEKDLAPMKERLDRLGGWPVLDDFGIWDEDDFDWGNMTVLLIQEGWAADMLVDMYLGTEGTDSSRHRLELSQPELGIPREYLVQGLTDEVVQTYFEMMVEVAVQFGAPMKYAMEELSDVLMFEIELAKIEVPQEKMRDHFRLNNPMTLLELEEHFPYANWSVMLMNGLQGFTEITPEETVVVEVPEYFQKLGPLLERVDKRVIANYIIWHVVYEALPYLPKRVAEIRRKLMIALTGARRFRPRWEFCLSNVLERFEHVVGSRYIRSHCQPSTKKAATDMVRIFLKQFQYLVENVPWMCEETRSIARQKAARLFYHVAYPNELLDEKVLEKYYQKMNMSRDDFLGNSLNGQKFECFRAFSRLHHPVNKTRWDTHSEVTEVNAYYINDQNAIEIPAGILQDIFYSPDRPNYLNFGALGYVIAHELIHSVDDEGKQYDMKGNLKNWWDWQTHREFDQRAARIIDEYSSYVVNEINMTLNGVNLQGEVIADHGGVKVAYEAYRSWAHSRPKEPSLPLLQQFTPQQMFWLSAANSWCTKERPESLRLGVRVDVHPPAEFRVNGPFRHAEPFAKDWSCPSGSYMNPIDKYNVW